MNKPLHLFPSFLCLILLLCSCSSDHDKGTENIINNDNLCIIQGRVTDEYIPFANHVSKKYMVVQDSWNGFKDIASSRINNDGTFRIEVDASKISHVYLYAGSLRDRKKRGQFRDFILEPGTIEVTGDFSDESSLSYAAGTPLNDKWQEFRTRMKEESSLEMKRRLFDELMSENTEDELRLFVLEHMAGPLSDPYYNANCYRLFKTLDEDLQKGRYVSESLDEFFKDISSSSPYFEPGASYVNIHGVSLDGERKELSSYFGKGKYVLVDYWGTWCSACVKGLPEIVDFFNNKDENITLVGINVNESLSRKELSRFAAEHNISWDLLIADKGSGDFGQLFPTMMLFDASGKLIRSDHPDRLLPEISAIISNNE